MVYQGLSVSLPAAGKMLECGNWPKNEETKDREIEVGDKVRYITDDPDEIKETGYYPPKGTIGTVIGIDSIFSVAPYHIKWPEGTTKWNGCWYVERKDIELI